MLAPSYHRINRQRERGISLSRTSSVKKFNSSIVNNHQLNQSFECIEPNGNMSCFESNAVSGKKDNQ